MITLVLERSKMQRSTRYSVQWMALRKLQKADDAVSLFFKALQRPSSASKNFLFALGVWTLFLVP